MDWLISNSILNYLKGCAICVPVILIISGFVRQFAFQHKVKCISFEFSAR